MFQAGQPTMARLCPARGYLSPRDRDRPHIRDPEIRPEIAAIDATLATGDGIMLLMCASCPSNPSSKQLFYFSSQLKQIESGPKHAPHCGIVRAAFSIRIRPKED